MENMFYDYRLYESVDDRSHLELYLKIEGKQNSGSKVNDLVNIVIK